MGIVNRRNAMLGWTAWQIGKRVARKKAKNAAPSIDAGSKRPNKTALLAAAVAALVGGIVFWKRQRGGGESDSTE